MLADKENEIFGKHSRRRPVITIPYGVCTGQIKVKRSRSHSHKHCTNTGHTQWHYRTSRTGVGVGVAAVDKEIIDM